MKLGNVNKRMSAIRRQLIAAGAPGSVNDSPYKVADAFLAMRGVAPAATRRNRLLQAMQIATGQDFGRKPVTVGRQPRKERSARHAVPTPSQSSKKTFYASWDWRKLRMEVLKEHGHRCQSCGATPNDATVSGARVRIVVDHIKPLSKFWNLRLDRTNLQVLCDECNMGKGAWDETDYRPANDDEPEAGEDPLTREWREIIGKD